MSSILHYSRDFFIELLKTKKINIYVIFLLNLEKNKYSNKILFFTV